MSVSVGSRLGPYDIRAPLGAGAMGEVYRATDTRLKRQVAVKVLPLALASDPDRLARFQREAEVLASLNRPGIAAVYGLEESAGVKALVMELVEGPTLADRITQGAIPVDEALSIARQIARGARGRGRAGHRPSRSEAGQHQGARGRRREGARLGLAKLSPDGRLMAYVSNESGTPEVYVQPYPGPGEKRRISTAFGFDPLWTAGGRELVYRSFTADGKQLFLSVPIRSTSPFQFDTPRLLFEAKAAEYDSTAPERGWAVSPDGQRFLLAKPVAVADPPVTAMHVVLNWVEELKRRAISGTSPDP